MLKETEKFSRNEELTPGHRFPLKVTEWSGTITHTDESWGSDIGVPWFHDTVITTIAVTNGAVTSVDVKVTRETKKEPGGSTETGDESGEPAP